MSRRRVAVVAAGRTPFVKAGKAINAVRGLLERHQIDPTTAAAKIPDEEGYLAAVINFRFIANAVWTTDHAVSLIAK